MRQPYRFVNPHSLSLYFARAQLRSRRQDNCFVNGRNAVDNLNVDDVDTSYYIVPIA